MQFLRFLGLCCQFLRLVVFSQKSVSLTKSVQDWSAEVEVSLKLSELMTVLLIKVLRCRKILIAATHSSFRQLWLKD